jgi:Transposase IS66 family
VTGWREQNKKAWIWVGANDRATAFQVHRSRGFDALQALLGEDPGRDRVIISDRFPTSPREVRRDLSALRVPRIRLVRPEDEVEEHAHLAVRLDRMSQRAVQVHLVAIPPPLARAREVTSFLEVGHDPLDGPLGDPHPMCHLSEAHLGLFCDAE